MTGSHFALFICTLSCQNLVSHSPCIPSSLLLGSCLIHGEGIGVLFSVCTAQCLATLWMPVFLWPFKAPHACLKWFDVFLACSGVFLCLQVIIQPSCILWPWKCCHLLTFIICPHIISTCSVSPMMIGLCFESTVSHFWKTSTHMFFCFLETECF